MLTAINETKADLLRDLGLENAQLPVLDKLAESNHRYLKDLRLNLKAGLTSDNLTEKEVALTALAVAINEENTALTEVFEKQAVEAGATEMEIAEMSALTSLLSTNNVLYRFRHFTNKDVYEQSPAKVKMNIMMQPATGKEFFELVSLAISAVNGCERCVNAHEASLLKIGTSEARIFDSVRLASVVVGAAKVIR